ncbi:TraR/DksA family transcriptional regulator [Neisseria leonii]|uniref:TraR/DksA family transcriptional regulator n=1 Tax=Neisseria leonii TaxID=2995413 RepID=UPI00237B1147|nr:TraR/DksA family transcriptional regulator [Neisseria sp. 3986]MDD9325628.1 TraR/DksA family transcriptional regulator [Neisseria sp. 3986]
MTDFIDRAAEAEAVFLADALHRARRPSENAVSAYECEDCGAAIPEARRQAVPGCIRCVCCQAYAEHGWP